MNTKKIFLSVIVLAVMLATVGMASAYDNSVDLIEKNITTWDPIEDGNSSTLSYSMGCDEVMDYEFDLNTPLDANTDYCLVFYTRDSEDISWDNEDDEVWKNQDSGLINKTTTNESGWFTEPMNGTFDFSKYGTGLDCIDDGDDYNGSVYGAKVWLVPCDDFTEEDNGHGAVTGWNPSDFLFEEDLITPAEPYCLHVEMDECVCQGDPVDIEVEVECDHCISEVKALFQQPDGTTIEEVVLTKGNSYVGALSGEATTDMSGDYYVDIVITTGCNEEVVFDNVANLTVDTEPPTINEALALSPIVALLPGDIEGRTYGWGPTGTYLVVNVTDNCFPCCCEAEANFSEMIRKMLHRVDIPEEVMVMIIEQMNDDFNYWGEPCYCEEEGYKVLCNDFDAMYFVGNLVEELYNCGIVESETDAMTLLLEQIELGNFTIPINITDCCGNYNNEEEIELTIVDVMVPLKQGWNVRSTPIALKYPLWDDVAALGDGLNCDKVARFNLTTQSFEPISEDFYFDPLEAVYIHMNGNDQVGIIMLRGITGPPERDLVRGWNLVGMALPLFSEMPIKEALVTIEVAAGAGDRGYNQVLSIPQHVEYYEELEYPCCAYEEPIYKHFYQEGWVFTCGSDNGHNADNCGGYWINMENDDTLGGFTGTPPMFVFGGP